MPHHAPWQWRTSNESCSIVLAVPAPPQVFDLTLGRLVTDKRQSKPRVRHSSDCRYGYGYEHKRASDGGQAVAPMRCA